MLTGLAGLTALSGIMGESAIVTPPVEGPPMLNLQGWWKADAGIIKEGDIPATADGDAVYQWQDSGPAGNYLAQGTLANRPTLKLNIQNGLPVVRFDGVDDYMQRSFTRNRPSTFFAVFRKSASGSRYVVDGDNNILALLSPDEASVQVYNGAAFNAACTPGNWIAVSVVWNGATSKVSVNGAMPTVGDTGLTGGSTVFNLGRRGSGASFWQGDIGEVLQYSGAMADVDREAVEDYLIARWNISTAPPPFAPTDVVGLQAWYKADGTRWQDSARTVPAVADADPVGALDDYSGNSRHLTQATAAMRPTLKLAIQNSLPVIRFDGVDDRIINATFARTQPCTTFVVVKKTGTGNRYIIDGTNQVAIASGDEASHKIFSGVSLNGVSVPANWNVVCGVFNGATSKITINGTVTTGDALTANATATNVGMYGGAAAFWQGDIGEILHYSGALSDVDRVKVEDYLRTRGESDMATAYVARMNATVPVEHIDAFNAFITEGVDPGGGPWIVPNLSPTGEEPATHGRTSTALTHDQFVKIAGHICGLCGITKPVGWDEMVYDDQLHFIQDQQDPIFAASGIWFTVDDNTGAWQDPQAILDELGLQVIQPAMPGAKEEAIPKKWFGRGNKKKKGGQS